MEKQFLLDSVERHAPQLTALSDQIWEFAELSLREYRSAQAYRELLTREGFAVEDHLAGLPTAFSGRFGSGKPVIGILGEFDALSGLSQAPGVPEKRPLAGQDCGHGCGHNLLGAASLGAAIALKEWLQATRRPGTVVFYGCPGEEGCAGKAFMAREGLFRDLDAALCWHPGDVNEITTGSNAASLQVEYLFTGIASHAAESPEQGRSALDAAELMNIGVQFLREHMAPGCSVHYSFLDAGGVSPNVVQPTAKLLYMVRGDCVRTAKALLARVDNIAQGAALMTGTQVVSRQIDGTSSTVSNHVLEQCLYDNFRSIPLPEYTRAERDFAQALKASCPAGKLPGLRTGEDPSLRQFVAEESENGAKALNDFLLPYAPSLHQSQGSTDVGDVSWLTPTAQFTALTWVSGAPGHSWQNVSIGKTSIAHKGMLLATKVLAATAQDLMARPELLSRAREEFTRATAQGYDCPIAPGVLPE